jgi:molybdopterin-guanine dinucleotide biosynthesis protein A
LAEALSERLSEVASPVCEVGPGRTSLAQADGDPGEGPLTAIVAGWRCLRALGHVGPVLVLATDLPKVSVPLLAWLADRPGEPSVVPVVDGRPQPLCARWAPDDLDRAERIAASGERAVRAALGPATAYAVEADWGPVASASDFADVDTPDDARRLGLDQSP